MNCWRQANQSLSFRCCARAELRPVADGTVQTRAVTRARLLWASQSFTRHWHLTNRFYARRMILGLPKSRLPSNGFAAKFSSFGCCHELGVLFFSLFLSIPEICLAKIIARHVLHEGIIHILQVGDSNWAFFFRSWTSPAAYENFKKKYEMPKELISYQYPTK